MASDDDRNHRKRNSSRNGRPDLVETCFGVWSRSVKVHKAVEKELDSICNGIHVVKIRKGANLTKEELSRTRGLLVAVRATDTPVGQSSPKVYDHTYIRVERDEAEDKLQENDNSHANEAKTTEEHGESLTERVKDVIKKTTPKKVEKGKDVEQKRREIKQQRHEKENEQREEKLGVRPEEILWIGFRSIMDRFANCYEISGRILSYCHPIEKIGQIVGFAERCIKSAGRKFVEGNDDKKKK